MPPTESFDAGQAAAQITRSLRYWESSGPSGPVVSYAFRASVPTEQNPGTASQFSPQQIGAATMALELWSDVANIRFEQASFIGYYNDASILFGNYDNSMDPRGGFCVTPDTGKFNAAFESPQGDVWINLADAKEPNIAGAGTFHYETILHEIGHALGLEHPGDYDSSEVPPPTYDDDAIYREDTRQYTVMSYWSESESGADYRGANVLTPLLHDIAAAQRIYGANITTRGLNDVYGSNATANRSVFNFDANQAPVVAIWDTGGIDTLSIANVTTPFFPLDGQVLDLREGAFSSTYGLIGGIWQLMVDNVAIAFGTVIENAIGSPGDDSISGNGVANSLVGGGGDDTIEGREGRDTIDGGSGNDILFGEAFTLFGAPIPAGADQLRGGSGNDTLLGQGGNDLLDGDDGDDVLDGGAGADTMRGGLGDDIYFVDDAGDSVSEFISAGQGRFAIRGDAGSIDEVRASVAAYSLPDKLDNWIENLVFVGNGSFTGTGNRMANRIVGGASADTLRGAAGDDTLVGGGGPDRLDGGPGADQLAGGLGNDTYDGVDELDTLIEDGFGGIDTVRTDLLEYTLPAWLENLVLTTNRGSATGRGNDADNLISGNIGSTAATGARYVLYGLGGNDRLVGGNQTRGDTLDGGAGDDTIEGGGGNDTLIGGPGADRLDGGGRTDTADYRSAAAAVALSLAGGGRAGEAAGDVFVAVENVVGSAFDDDIAGDALANNLVGLAGSDTLDGGAGDDTLDGGDGRNLLIGGAGNDSLLGGPLFDSFDGGNGNDTLRGGGGQTAMLGGAGNDLLIGSLTSGNAMEAGPGNDSLVGGDFADSMQDTTGGDDTMRGGGGGDTLIDYAGVNALFGEGGNDWIVSASTLGSLLDGGDGDDVLFCNGGGNRLLGGPGADLLENQGGGAVANHFEGGAGADVFVYRVGVAAPSVVRVVDFEPGVDRIGLRFERFEDLLISDGPEGAVIQHLAAGSPMTLVGIWTHQLSALDFVSV